MIYSVKQLSWHIPGGPPKNGTVDTVNFSRLARWTVFFFTLLDRASFPHYNNNQDHQIWLRTFYFMSNFLWTVISGFARFPEFWGTINDSFSSTCANTIPAFNQLQKISVPMMCLDCKSLLGNTKELQTQATWQYTDHWTQYSLNLWTAEAVINRASELWKSSKSRKWQSIWNYSKNKIWWSWCYYNEEKMLYPARWTKITVDQSKVLKNKSTVPVFWATRYNGKMLFKVQTQNSKEKTEWKEAHLITNTLESHGESQLHTMR